MFVSNCLRTNQENHLEIGGCDAVALAKEYGTPLYVMDETCIRENCRLYTQAMKKYYNDNGLILYANKAFCTLAMCNIVKDEGLGVDVVSGGELYTALAADFPASKIYFHGNNKTREELVMAVEHNVGRIVVDNVFELETLNELASERGKVVDILFRIKPGIDAHTHSFIRTGQIDSKFGVALETGEAFEIVRHASELKNVRVVGVHCHIGSQIFDLEPFEQAADVMMFFIAECADKLGIAIKELNLGGGYGIRYTEDDHPVEYDKYIEAVSEIVKKSAEKHQIDLPFILMEPGRSIAGPAGITLYTIGGVKDIPGIRKYLSVDGGMCDNPRYILYESAYDFELANRMNVQKTEKVTVAGKCCESGDLLGKDVLLPPAEPGDILAVLATGAYNYSMASNYNRIPKPAVVLTKNGTSRLIVKRETYEDLIRHDIR